MVTFSLLHQIQINFIDMIINYSLTKLQKVPVLLGKCVRLMAVQPISSIKTTAHRFHQLIHHLLIYTASP